MVTVVKKGTPIEQILKLIKSARKKSRKTDLTQFAGKLVLKQDVLSVQKEMRDEWE